MKVISLLNLSPYYKEINIEVNIRPKVEIITVIVKTNLDLFKKLIIDHEFSEYDKIRAENLIRI